MEAGKTKKGKKVLGGGRGKKDLERSRLFSLPTTNSLGHQEHQRSDDMYPSISGVLAQFYGLGALDLEGLGSSTHYLWWSWKQAQIAQVPTCP